MLHGIRLSRLLLLLLSSCSLAAVPSTPAALSPSTAFPDCIFPNFIFLDFISPWFRSCFSVGMSRNFPGSGFPLTLFSARRVLPSGSFDIDVEALPAFYSFLSVEACPLVCASL